MDRPVAAVAEIQARRDGGLHDLPSRLNASRHFEADGVEVLLVQLTDAERGQLALQPLRVRMDAPRDSGQAFRTVIHRIESGDVGEKRLRGADVRRRLFAADVLLAGLQRHAVRRMAVHVH